jgi:CRISPR-associated protein Cas1
MKRPFDFLMTDKEPFVYAERSFLVERDGTVVKVGSDGSIETIPIASTMLIFLGPGTSITHDAARACAENDCFIGFVNGMVNVHSLWHAGRWPSPERAVEQVRVFSDPALKLRAAKLLLSEKFKRDGHEAEIERLNGAASIEEAMGIEASLAKSTYAALAREFGTTFTRDQGSIEGVNGKISLLNNVLYSYFSAVATAYGLNPSLGFVHGETRRGGLAFDVADIFKTDLSLRYAFANSGDSNQKAMHKLASRIKAKKSKVTKEALRIMDLVLEVK